MAGDAPLWPIEPRDFGPRQARHLLNRAGFGGLPAQVSALVGMGLDKAVDYLVDYEKVNDASLPPAECDPGVIVPPSLDEQRDRGRARRENDRAALDRLRAEQLRRQVEDRRQMAGLERWWLARMIATPRPLQEKLALLWHGHFAASNRTVDDSYLMLRQNELFRAHAAGSFAELALGIVHDPAMIKYLNNNQNRSRQPNENLARELMELFTLGVGHYTEEDIREGARALTGYFVNDNDFRFVRLQHDAGSKRILGRTGTFDGDEFVKIILAQPACPRWVAFKLYRHFVADLSGEPTPEARSVIEQLARDLYAGRYQIAPVLKTLFRSRHFYDDAIVGGKIKSPAELLVGSVRTMGLPVRDLDLLTDAMAMMGQRLFHPPSVAGWDGGRAWINTSTLFIRQNSCAYLLTDKPPFDDGWTRSRIGFDPRKFVEGLPSRSVDAIVDHLAAMLLSVPLTPDRRGQLVAFLTGRSDPAGDEAILALLLLITAMPEYQLC